MKKLGQVFEKHFCVFLALCFLTTIFIVVVYYAVSLVSANSFVIAFFIVFVLYCLTNASLFMQAVKNEEDIIESPFRSFRIPLEEDLTSDKDVLSMSDEEIKKEIEYLRKRNGVLPGIGRTEVDGSPYSGEVGDLLALRALDAYMRKRKI